MGPLFASLYKHTSSGSSSILVYGNNIYYSIDDGYPQLPTNGNTLYFDISETTLTIYGEVTYLDCSNSFLTRLDLSQCSQLSYLNCGNCITETNALEIASKILLAGLTSGTLNFSNNSSPIYPINYATDVTNPLYSNSYYNDISQSTYPIIYSLRDVSNSGWNILYPPIANIPSKVCVDDAGIYAYVANSGSHCITRIELSTGTTSIIAGTYGVPGYSNDPSGSLFCSPHGVFYYHRYGNAPAQLLVSDSGNHCIRILEITTNYSPKLFLGIPGVPGYVDYVPTNILATIPNFETSYVLFNFPTSIVVSTNTYSSALEIYYIADCSNNVIRMYGSVHANADGKSIVGKSVSTLIGYKPESSTYYMYPLNGPRDILADVGPTIINRQSIAISNTNNHSVCVFSFTTSISPQGPSLAIVLGTIDSQLILGDVYDLSGSSPTSLHRPTALAIDTNNHIYVADNMNNRVQIVQYDASFCNIGTIPSNRPNGVWYFASKLFVTDEVNDSLNIVPLVLPQLVQYPISTFIRKTIPYSGKYEYMCTDGINIFFADQQNHCIVRIDKYKRTYIFAGTYGDPGYLEGSGGTYVTNSTSKFHSPTGITIHQNFVNPLQTTFFVADSGNHCVRILDVFGNSSLYAGIPMSPGFIDGNSQTARLNYPTHIACVTLDSSSTIVYITDSLNNAVRIVYTSNATKWIHTVLSSTDSTNEDIHTLAIFSLDYPCSLIVRHQTIAQDGSDSVVTLLVVDKYNNQIVSVDNLFNSYIDGTIRYITCKPSSNIHLLQNIDGSVLVLDNPSNITIDTHRNIYISDTGNNRILSLLSSGLIPTVQFSYLSLFVGTEQDIRLFDPYGIVLQYSSSMIGTFYIIQSHANNTSEIIIATEAAQTIIPAPVNITVDSTIVINEANTTNTVTVSVTPVQLQVVLSQSALASEVPQYFSGNLDINFIGGTIIQTTVAPTIDIIPFFEQKTNDVMIYSVGAVPPIKLISKSNIIDSIISASQVPTVSPSGITSAPTIVFDSIRYTCTFDTGGDYMIGELPDPNITEVHIISVASSTITVNILDSVFTTDVYVSGNITVIFIQASIDTQLVNGSTIISTPILNKTSIYVSCGASIQYWNMFKNPFISTGATILI
jgi:hypothetical protein